MKTHGEKIKKKRSPRLPEAIFQNMFAVRLDSLLTFGRQLVLLLAPFFHPLDPLKTAAGPTPELFRAFMKIDA